LLYLFRLSFVGTAVFAQGTPFPFQGHFLLPAVEVFGAAFQQFLLLAFFLIIAASFDK
jgi:hypothetical protein